MRKFTGNRLAKKKCSRRVSLRIVLSFDTAAPDDRLLLRAARVGSSGRTNSVYGAGDLSAAPVLTVRKLPYAGVLLRVKKIRQATPEQLVSFDMSASDDLVHSNNK